MYTVKKVSDFPVLSRDVSNQTLPGGEWFNYSIPRRESLVTDIPVWDEEISNLFRQCSVNIYFTELMLPVISYNSSYLC